MSQVNLSNIRIIMDSYSRLQTPLFGLLPVSLASSERDGYSALYSITEERYKLHDQYKIGLQGNLIFGVPNENYYQSDLKNLLKNSDNPFDGVYEIINHYGELDNGEILSLDVNVSKYEIKFEIPLVIIEQDEKYYYCKSVIENRIKNQFYFKNLFFKLRYGTELIRVEKEKGAMKRKFNKISLANIMPQYKNMQAA